MGTFFLGRVSISQGPLRQSGLGQNDHPGVAVDASTSWEQCGQMGTSIQAWMEVMRTVMASSLAKRGESRHGVSLITGFAVLDSIVTTHFGAIRRNARCPVWPVWPVLVTRSPKGKRLPGPS